MGEALNRRCILDFVRRAADELEPGARVLDAGAGNAPYRELFAHCRYMTSDWEHSVHDEAGSADMVAPLDGLPTADASFDAVILTEVLEHVPEPGPTLAEIHRVLAPGGELWLTTPLVWPLHEEPYDFWRYTHHGLVRLLEGASFQGVEVERFGGYFLTLGQLVRACGPLTGMDEGAALPRRAVGAALWRIGPWIARLDRLDRRRELPIGFGARARKP